MKLRFILTAFAALVSLTLYGQKAQTAKSKNAMNSYSTLYSDSWNLVELNGISTVQPGAKPAYLTFQPGDFNYNRITGFSGCNYITGRVDLNGDEEITFFPDLLTNNNCAGSSIETPLINTLMVVDSWSEKNGQLLLYKKGKVVARWNASHYDNANLYGTWQLNYFSDDTTPFQDLFPVTNRPSIVFVPGKKEISGYTGCKEFSCPIVINNSTIIFTDHPAQDTTCQQSGEAAFLKTLNSINTYAFKDDQTLVLISDKDPVMAFTRFK